MAGPFHSRFRATQLAARQGIGATLRYVAQAGLSADQQGNVEIALAEAVNNVVEHGYPGPSRGDVTIEGHIQSQTLTITIRDAGRTFPDLDLPVGRAPDLSGPVQDLPEGGFGWFLIRAMTKSVCYKTCHGQNTLRLVFDLSNDTAACNAQEGGVSKPPQSFPTAARKIRQ